MNTNMMELNLNEMEKVNGSSDLVYVITKAASFFSNIFGNKKSDNEKSNNKKNDNKPKKDSMFRKGDLWNQ